MYLFCNKCSICLSMLASRLHTLLTISEYISTLLYKFSAVCGGVLQLVPVRQDIIASPDYDTARNYSQRQECSWWLKVSRINRVLRKRVNLELACSRTRTRNWGNSKKHCQMPSHLCHQPWRHKEIGRRTGTAHAAYKHLPPQ